MNEVAGLTVHAGTIDMVKVIMIQSDHWLGSVVVLASILKCACKWAIAMVKQTGTYASD